jgi:hypothetical protein
VQVLPASHLVHFYSTPEGLAQSLCGFFAEPLKRGESVIIVARPEHRQALDAALRDAGVDLAAELRAGRYVSLDVTETLDAFLVDDRPSRELFDKQTGALVLGAKQRTGVVHAYGELSAALLMRGDVVAALEFETMWDELVREVPFPLVCGYPRDALEGDLAGVIDGVASVHDALLVARSRARPDPGTVLDLPLGPGATGTARRHLRDLLTARGHQDAESLDDAAVVVTELLATAARQGSRHVRLSLTSDDAGLVLSMLDAAPSGEPARNHGTEDEAADAGRSFAVLGALAEGWGVERSQDGRTVWARLRPPTVA